jgi:tRNA (cytidine/uridine-2'-O-)-methyltransferase
LNVVLYQPEIPQNTGNIGRTCVALGATLWIVRPIGFRLDDHHLKRSGMDYWDHLTWEDVPNFDAVAERLAPARTFFVTKFATKDYTEMSYRRGDTFVFGRESNGLPQELRDANWERCIGIPMHSAARSLNLSNAVAIVAYEAHRQIQLTEKLE